MLKLISGTFAYGQTVTIDTGKRTIRRKVHYGILDGLYVVIDGEKIGYKTLTSGRHDSVGTTEKSR